MEKTDTRTVVQRTEHTATGKVYHQELFQSEELSEGNCVLVLSRSKGWNSMAQKKGRMQSTSEKHIQEDRIGKGNEGIENG